LDIRFFLAVDTQSAQLLGKPGNFVEFREGQGSIREFMEKSERRVYHGKIDGWFISFTLR